MKTIALANVDITLTVAAKLAQQCTPPLIIYLQGDLGAGKTTFSRGFIQALGLNGNVKSPTYTLVEPYDLGVMQIFHFDLYRLHHPQELLDLGVEDYCQDNSICLIEWPDKGGEFLPRPDLTCFLQLAANGRQLQITAHNAKAQKIIEKLSYEY